MNSLQALLLTGGSILVGCITVNINFPPKEVEKAAEVIVGEARPPGNDGGGGTSQDSAGGEVAPAGEPAEPAPPPASEGSTPPAPPPPPPSPSTPAPPGETARGEELQASRGILVSFSPDPPAAEEKKEESRKDDIRINIETPVIKKIRESLKARFPKLERSYARGVIGENRDGYVEIRDDSSLGVAEKRTIKALVEEENKDRRNLYLEIVKENRFDESRLKDVQRIFAAQWAEKSREGWWVETKDGKWQKKPPPKDAKKSGKKAS